MSAAPRSPLARTSLLLVALAGACSAPRTERAAELPPPALECTCGASESDVFGCACLDCSAGRGDASNPDCTCAPPAAGTTAVAEGELEARARYRAENARIEHNDAPGQLELFALALELGLFARARIHLELAESAAPASSALVADLRSELDRATVARLWAEAEAARSEQRASDASRWYAAILTGFVESAYSVPAAEALASTALAEREARALRRAEWSAEEEALLASVADGIERVHEYAHRGLMCSGSGLKAIACLERALDQGDAVRVELEELRAEAPAEAGWLRLADELERELVERMVAICGLLADSAARRGAFETARQAALRARALAPQSEAALLCHARVVREARQAGWSL